MANTKLFILIILIFFINITQAQVKLNVNLDNVPSSEQLLTESEVTNAEFDLQDNLENFNDRLSQYAKEAAVVEQYVQNPENSSFIRNQNYAELIERIIKSLDEDLEEINALISQNEQQFSANNNPINANENKDVANFKSNARRSIYLKNSTEYIGIQNKLEEKITAYEDLSERLNNVSFGGFFEMMSQKTNLLVNFKSNLAAFEKGLKDSIKQLSYDYQVWKTRRDPIDTSLIFMSIFALVIGVFIQYHIKNKILPYYKKTNDSAQKKDTFMFFSALKRALIPNIIIVGVVNVIFRRGESSYENDLPLLISRP